MESRYLGVPILDEDGRLKPVRQYVRGLEERIGRKLTPRELSKVHELHERTEALRFFG